MNQVFYILLIISHIFTHSYIGSTITLKGKDINSLPLLEYRQEVQAFPQNSYIFSGTVRAYLDPYHSHSDVKMNNVLHELHQAVRNEDVRINLVSYSLIYS